MRTPKLKCLWVGRRPSILPAFLQVCDPDSAFWDLIVPAGTSYLVVREFDGIEIWVVLMGLVAGVPGDTVLHSRRSRLLERKEL